MIYEVISYKVAGDPGQKVTSTHHLTRITEEGDRQTVGIFFTKADAQNVSNLLNINEELETVCSDYKRT